jgi:hypothetical protein
MLAIKLFALFQTSLRDECAGFWKFQARFAGLFGASSLASVRRGSQAQASSARSKGAPAHARLSTCNMHSDVPSQCTQYMAALRDVKTPGGR